MQISNYCLQFKCRHQQICEYFNDNSLSKEPCRNCCDVCIDPESTRKLLIKISNRNSQLPLQNNKDNCLDTGEEPYRKRKSLECFDEREKNSPVDPLKKRASEFQSAAKLLRLSKEEIDCTRVLEPEKTSLVIGCSIKLREACLDKLINSHPNSSVEEAKNVELKCLKSSKAVTIYKQEIIKQIKSSMYNK